MKLSQRQEGAALRRPLAVLGATAVAVGALVPLSGAAVADSHVQDLTPACEGLTDSVGFEDIAFLAAPTQDAINCAYNYEITKGKVDGEVYAPVDAVKRYEMALFISRSIDVIEIGADIDVVDAGAAAPSTFADLGGVPGEAKAAIDRLAELGIVNGKSSSTYDPHGSVNRRDMARFINRLQTEIVADAFPGAEYDPADRTTQFPDVPDTMKGSSDIYAIQSAGIVQGHTSGRYEPFQAVRRDHMALYIMRHLADNIEAGNLFWFFDDEAEDGFSGSVNVEYVDKDYDLFGDADTSFWYDDNDAFTVDGKTATIGQFEAALSSGDGITVTSYQRDPDLRSRFDLQNVNPAAPTVAATVGARGYEDDVTVTVTPADEHWNTVRLERVDPDGSIVDLATLTVDDADVNGVVTYQDDDLPAGEYRYRALVENDGDLGPWSTAVVTTSEPSDVIAPTAVATGLHVSRQDPVVLDLADVFYVAFGEQLEDPSINDVLVVEDEDGTVAHLINDQANAYFSLSTGPMVVGGQEYPAGHVLLVETIAPKVVTAGDAIGVGLPATIVGQSGIKDANGNAWDVASSSDLVIEPPA